MQVGHKHLIECRCILSQFQKMRNPPLHKFIVFSILEDDVMLPKLAQCNNCGIVHKVIDFCKSEIVRGKEHANSIISIDEVKQSLPSKLCDALSSYDIDLPTWEAIKFIIENERWGEHVVLSTDDTDGMRQGKYLRILGKTLYKVDSFTSDGVLSFNDLT